MNIYSHWNPGTSNIQDESSTGTTLCTVEIHWLQNEFLCPCSSNKVRKECEMASNAGLMFSELTAFLALNHSVFLSI